MPQDAQETLEGTIWPIALNIEDGNTHDIIKSTSIYLHVSRSQLPNKDPAFVNISITAVYQDGSFHTDITAESVAGVFRGDRVVPEDRISVLSELFPVDYDDWDPDALPHLRVEARLIALQSQYDADSGELLDTDEDPNSGRLALSIQTDDKVPVTVGSLDLVAVELDGQEGNLFNWLNVVHLQRSATRSESRLLKKRIASLEQDLFAARANYQASVHSHRRIVEDLEQKFYQLLDSKKEKIWDLTKKQYPEDHLENLNEGYKSRGLNFINTDEIADQLDQKYIKKRPSPVKREGIDNKPASKRRKVKTEHSDSEHSARESSPAKSPELKDSQSIEVKEEPAGDDVASENDQDAEKTDFGDSDCDGSHGDQNDPHQSASEQESAEEAEAAPGPSSAKSNSTTARKESASEVEDSFQATDYSSDGEKISTAKAPEVSGAGARYAQDESDPADTDGAQADTDYGSSDDSS